MDFTRATLNFLTRRYAAPDRLRNLPPLADLPSEHNPDFIGNITIWDWSGNLTTLPVQRHFLAKTYKAQHATIWRDKLLVCGTAFLEIYPLTGPFEKPEQVITHPWFSGAHTVFVDELGRFVVSCSAPDALLFFRPDGTLADAWRIPAALYGRNYDLSRSDDLRAHYIGNDQQAGHINCGAPAPDGCYLCSLLIPGAVGLFDRQGGYRELTTGYVGCHGARPLGPHGFYFSDSCNGLIVEMDWNGRVRRRFQLNSGWLHDVLHLGDGLYLCALSDHNTIELWDTIHGTMAWRLSGESYGATTQFISAITP
ncbi:MAG: hypothetical protein PSV13_09430 [Lacunisphaera sp.]|nr:hypothetical protein [Lacunisphaera sp.]